MITNQKKGKQVFNLKTNDYLVKVLNYDKKYLACVTKLAKMLIFDTESLPTMNKGLGVQIIKIKDPTNVTLEKWKRPNGLSISKITIPIGVIGIIYESRPNVTSDIASLCFKSGNPVILKGGKEAFHSNKILSKLFRNSLKKNKIDENFVQFISSKNRKVVNFLLGKLNSNELLCFRPASLAESIKSSYSIIY